MQRRKREKEKKEKEEKDKKEKEKKEKKKEKEKARKEKKTAEKQAQEEAEASAEAAPPTGKGKGSGKSRAPKTKEEKAKLPCVFWAYDACAAGDKCEYIHDKNNRYKGPKPRKVKGSSDGAASVLAGAAFASAIPTSEAAIQIRGQAAQDRIGSPVKEGGG